MRPQRQPNGLVTGTLTGQESWPEPLPDDAAPPDDEPACAARILAPSEALTAWRASISDASARSFSLRSDSATTFDCRDAARSPLAPTSSFRTSRVCSVREAISLV